MYTTLTQSTPTVHKVAGVDCICIQHSHSPHPQYIRWLGWIAYVYNTQSTPTVHKVAGVDCICIQHSVHTHSTGGGWGEILVGVNCIKSLVPDRL